jgi:hypothetical protein
MAIGRALMLFVLALIARPESALADPITFAVRGGTGVGIFNPFAVPPVGEQEFNDVDEIFGADSFDLIGSDLTGSGTMAGYSGSGNAKITDSVIGVFATVTAPGTPGGSIFGNGYGGYIDYFTVLLPPGSFVPMSFTLDPTYTISTTGGACGSLNAFLQVGGAGDPAIGSLSYVDSTCMPDSLLTTVELMVPTGVPFRVLYELSATASAQFGLGGTATVDALNSLQLFANPVGSYAYQTMSGNNFLSPVPEPAALFTLASGLGWLAYRRRRTR